jgi:hypothetical protein
MHPQANPAGDVTALSHGSEQHRQFGFTNTRQIRLHKEAIAAEHPEYLLVKLG